MLIRPQDVFFLNILIKCLKHMHSKEPMFHCLFFTFKFSGSLHSLKDTAGPKRQKNRSLSNHLSVYSFNLNTVNIDIFMCINL